MNSIDFAMEIFKLSYICITYILHMQNTYSIFLDYSLNNIKLL